METCYFFSEHPPHQWKSCVHLSMSVVDVNIQRFISTTCCKNVFIHEIFLHGIMIFLFHLYFSIFSLMKKKKSTDEVNYANYLLFLFLFETKFAKCYEAFIPLFFKKFNSKILF